jgi:hypothetical protein
LKDKLEQVKKGLISPFGMSKGREVAYGGTGGVEILKAVLGNDNLQNRPDSLLNGMVKGMLSNIDLFSSGSVERYRTTDYGKYNVNYAVREGESSIIDKLRDLQVQSLLANDPNAFTKASTNLGIHTQIQFDAMNREGSVSDMSRFRGQVRKSQSLEILRRNAKTLANNKIRNAIKDANTNRLRTGGVLREGMEIDEEGAVSGGFTSLSEFRATSRIQYYQRVTASRAYVGLFGGGISSSAHGKNAILREYNRINQQASSYKDILSRAGLGIKSNIPSFGRALSYSQHQSRRAELNSILSYNNNQLAKAEQINILSGGYDLGAFRGSSLSAPALSDKVLEQDMLMKSIGLDRTEAFQIIDTFGRGREEIDDRIRWKDRINNISTGTTVL